MADSLLERFFIEIGIDAEDLTAGEKAVTAAVVGMKSVLEDMASAFDKSSKRASDSQKKLGKTSDKVLSHLKASANQTRNVFSGLKGELLGFAGISLSLMGAVKFVDNMTKSVMGLSVQSKMLGVSARELDGWQHAAQAVGSTPEAITGALTNAQNAANTAHATGDYSAPIYQVAARMGINDAFKDDGQTLITKIIQGLPKLSKEQQYTFGGMAGLDAATIQSASSGQFIPEVQKMTRLSSVSSGEEQGARRLTEQLAILDQKMSALQNRLYLYLIPEANQLVGEIDDAIPSVEKLGSVFVKYGNDFSKILKELLGIDLKKWTVKNDIDDLTKSLQDFRTMLSHLAKVFADLKSGNFTAAWQDAKKAWSGDIPEPKEKKLNAFDQSAVDARNKVNQWARGADDWLRGKLHLSRGIRNNNPGNIDYRGQKGATIERQGGRFAKFETAFDGLKAMASQLYRYFDGKTTGTHLDTIKKIVSTWAPGSENDTKSYIQSVAKKLGIDADAKLNLNDPTLMAKLMGAITAHENGTNPYTEQLISGAALAARQNVVNNNNTQSTDQYHFHGNVSLNSNPASVRSLSKDIASQSSLYSLGA